MIKLCIFDLDGTLVNSLKTITYYMNRTLTKHKIDPITENECQYFVGSGARNLMKRALLSRGIDNEKILEELLAEYNADYDSAPYYLSEVYPDITELLRSLKARGIALAVASNKPDFATREAIKYFFGDLFSFVRGGTSDMPLKPAPDIVYHIGEKLCAAPCQTAYIGDSDVDVKTAKNAGVALPIAVLWGFRTASELKAAGAEIFASYPADIEKMVLQHDI